MTKTDLFLNERDETDPSQALLGEGDQPLDGGGVPDFTPAQYATLVRLTQLKALLAVNKVRIEQVTLHGHTDESDADEPIFTMLKAARQRIDMALDRLTLGRTDQAENIAYAQRYTIKAAALLLAQIDRFDVILEKQGD